MAKKISSSSWFINMPICSSVCSFLDSPFANVGYRVPNISEKRFLQPFFEVRL